MILEASIAFASAEIMAKSRGGNPKYAIRTRLELEKPINIFELFPDGCYYDTGPVVPQAIAKQADWYYMKFGSSQLVAKYLPDPALAEKH